MKRSKKFNYIYSKEIDQEVATPKEGELVVYTSDGVIYNKSEVQLLKRSGRGISMSVHLVRLVFGGEIISIK